MTTDVHQQRQKARPSHGRRCGSCGIKLFDGETARQVKGVWMRVDTCLNCDTNGPPRRPQGSPPL